MKCLRLLLILWVGVLAGCAKEKLLPLQRGNFILNAKTRIEGSFCNLNLTTSKGMKFYFLVDVTGSNQRGDTTDTGVAVPPTDPGKTKRYAGMAALAQKFPDAKFALRTFAGNGVEDNFRDNYFDFTDASDFSSTTLQNFLTVLDDGGTNYIHPLQLALQDIQSYLTAQLLLPPAEQDPPGPLVVFFISDGIPNPGTARGQSDLQKPVQDLVALAVNNHATGILNEIVVNAGGYGGLFQIDPAGGQYIQWIAEAGGGTFLFFGDQIDFTQMRIPAPLTAPGSAFDLFATNLNVVWEKTADGGAELNWDSDGDGLSDKLEAQLGSDPEKYDTEDYGTNNGIQVSDGIKYLLYGRPCVLGNCAPPTDAQQTFVPINSCHSIPAANGGSSGYFANDMINNCEKLTIGASYQLFSYVGDKIPDGVKIRNGISALDQTLGQSTPGGDGMTILQKIMYNLPWWYSNTQAMGLKPTKYTTNFTGIQNGRSCYSFTIDDMPAMGPSPNRVRVQLVQSDAGLRDTLRYADVMVTPGQTAQLQDTDFTPH